MIAELPLVGRSRELARVAEALGRREPFLLAGPRGSGKTHLLLCALRTCPDAIYLRYPPVLHELLASLAGAVGQDPRHSSVRLRGLLWSAFEERPHVLVLDGVSSASHAVRRFLERLYFCPGTALVVSARDHAALGALNRLFWEPSRIIRLDPLPEGEARRLFELAADRFGLRRLSLDEFREQVLESARGNPGEIVEMCYLAADPRYVASGRVKFAPLRIDALIRLSG
jgi:hypothetical protein